MPVVMASVSEDPLDLGAHLLAVGSARQGALATFIGMVRDHDPEADGEVSHLDYSAHPSAPDVIRAVADEVCARLDPGDEAVVAVSHRVGRLVVGEAAIIAAVSSPHRALAFAICEDLVEEVKRSLPVWKLQHTSAGDEVWSGLPR